MSIVGRYQKNYGHHNHKFKNESFTLFTHRMILKRIHSSLALYSLCGFNFSMVVIQGWIQNRTTSCVAYLLYLCFLYASIYPLLHLYTSVSIFPSLPPSFLSSHFHLTLYSISRGDGRWSLHYVEEDSMIVCACVCVCEMTESQSSTCNVLYPVNGIPGCCPVAMIYHVLANSSLQSYFPPLFACFQFISISLSHSVCHILELFIALS